MAYLYLDHAATTPLDEDVLQVLLEASKRYPGNPSSLHRWGRSARVALEQARESISTLLGVEPAEILFTSGGSEADNAALRGVLRPGDHVITSLAEHEALLKTVDALEAEGVRVTRLRPEVTGTLPPERLAEALAAHPAKLVSLMWVNNETGAVNDIRALCSVAHEHGALFHTDAVQAPGLMPLLPALTDVDMASFSGHKFHAPKGTGFLLLRNGVPFSPVITGGSQERGRRAGTESVPALLAMAHAFVQAVTHQPEVSERLTALREYLRERAIAQLGRLACINTPEQAAPHILNLSFPPVNGTPIDGETLLLGMDLEGVAVSGGSACTSGALTPSHVLLAMGQPRATASAAVRFSMGKRTTYDEVDRAFDVLLRVLARQGVHST